MKALKNIFFGFIVSFFGSLPLGYLNIVGVEIYSGFGLNSLIYFLFGVLFSEAIVIYLTVKFVNHLVKNQRLMKFIDFFAVFFFLLLAFLFFNYSKQSFDEHHYLEGYINYSPFLIGVVLCAVNLLQIPFWMGWNLYLLNANYISLILKLKYFYIFGTLSGTFLGMLTAIITLDSISKYSFSIANYIMPIGIPLFFIGLAVFQCIKVYRKYFRAYTSSN